MFSQSQFNEWVDRKYANLEAGTANDALRAQADSALAFARAGAVAPTTISDGNLNAARQGLIKQQSKVVVPLAISEIANTRANTGYTQANTFGVQEDNIGKVERNAPGTQSIFDRLFGFAKGTAKVPGKGDGTEDTVPTMLAPGEAVLNKHAAESLGRGFIDALNKVGAQKMGLV